MMYTAGIDVGSTYTKAVVIDEPESVAKSRLFEGVNRLRQIVAQAKTA